jgi:hypothetical protein
VDLTVVVIVVVGCLIALAARRNLTFSMIALQVFLLVVVTLGALKLESRQDDLEETQAEITKTQSQLAHERFVRSKVQSEINRYVCSENNKQDRILAGLIEVSIGGQSSFGAGIDTSSLSPFDLEVIRAIAKVQRLSEGEGSQLKVAFEEALHQLQKQTPCGEVVQAFLAASTTDDLRAIRRILAEAASGKLKADHPHKRGKNSN